MNEVLPPRYLHALSTSDFGPGVGAVPRIGRGTVGVLDHPADHPVAARGQRLRGAGICPAPIRVPVGRRHPPRSEARGRKNRGLLVTICVSGDGRKELVTLTGGCRESCESYADLLCICRRANRVRKSPLGQWFPSDCDLVARTLRGVREPSDETRCEPGEFTPLSQTI